MHCREWRQLYCEAFELDLSVAFVDTSFDKLKIPTWAPHCASLSQSRPFVPSPIFNFEPIHLVTFLPIATFPSLFSVTQYIFIATILESFPYLGKNQNPPEPKQNKQDLLTDTVARRLSHPNSNSQKNAISDPSDTQLPCLRFGGFESSIDVAQSQSRRYGR